MNLFIRTSIAKLLRKSSVTAITSGMTKQVNDLRSLASLKFEQAAAFSDAAGVAEDNITTAETERRVETKRLGVELDAKIKKLEDQYADRMVAVEGSMYDKVTALTEKVIANNNAWEEAIQESEEANALANKLERNFTA